MKQINSLTEGIKVLEGKIKDKGKGLKEQGNLQSIIGRGELSSTIILCNIGDIADFENNR